MRYLRESREDEMIALFLRTEIASHRFGAAITGRLRADGVPDRTVTAPDLASAAENRCRRDLLRFYRGFGRDAELFHGFPSGVRWQRVAVNRDELEQIRYIRYDYWVELSGGSRLPTDAAERIRAGVEVFGVSNQGFIAAAERLVSGAMFPELILVSAGNGASLVVLEGHLRLTAYMLEPHTIPAELTVFVGADRLRRSLGGFH